MAQSIPLAQFVRIIETHHQRDVEICRRIGLEEFTTIKADIVRLVELADLVDTRAYVDGWKVKPTPKGATFYNAVPYARTIEYGRPAGAKKPPFIAILGWVQRKLQLEGHEAQNAAFFIRNAIGVRGIKPKFILRTAIRGATPRMRARMIAALNARGRTVYG